MEERKMYTIIEGGVTAATGFATASTAAGIKYKNRKDMALIYSEKPCKAAGTFTTNIVKITTFTNGMINLKNGLSSSL